MNTSAVKEMHVSANKMCTISYCK
uniref:Uncharacterized protein n=1 Tax=Anguilla anguilla TaxID=7936 RepID=A0A0E9VEY0_ANGAN